MDKIKVIIKKPGQKYGTVCYMYNTLESFQTAVGGYIETVPLGAENIMVVNEEGKIRGLEANMHVGSWPFGDTIRGTVVVVGHTEDEFSDVTIDFKQWKKLVDAWR